MYSVDPNSLFLELWQIRCKESKDCRACTVSSFSFWQEPLVEFYACAWSHHFWLF